MAFWRSRRETQHALIQALQPASRREQGKHSKRRSSRLEQFEPRRLLAVSPRLISIIPNEGELLTDGQTRDIAPRELTFRFSDGQIMDPASLGGIQIVRSGFDGVLGDGDDVLIEPGFIGIGDRSNEVVARFADALPDDLYLLRIAGSGANPLRNTEGDVFNDGVDVTVRFEMDLGAQVIAVVPQPITRLPNGALSQARSQIDVYFNNDDLNPLSAANRNFYQLIFTNATGNNRDDQVFLPSSVIYDAAQDKAVLTFAGDIASLGGQGVYRLRIGNADPISPAPAITQTTVDQGSTFVTAANLGPLGNQSKIIKAAVDPQLFRLELPGDISEPGHRESAQQSHFLAERAPDSTVGTTTAYYNFQDLYGVDPFGNQLFNTITEEQKERTRELFSLYGYYAGIQFIESDDRGMTIVTGDPRALDPTVETGPFGVIGIAAGGLVGTAIMDRAEDWGANEYGGFWFQTAMHEIGHLLGLGHADELAPLTIMSGITQFGDDVEQVFPGDQDIAHARYKYRPEIKDIDVYRLSVAATGTISAEVVAERLPEASELDALVSIFDSSGRLLARNDDYIGNDAFAEIEVPAGDYFVVVSSTGNNEYNLNVEDSGFEGTTQGNYALRLDFSAKPTAGLTDATGTVLDGDGDGVAGGEYNFWFQASTSANTVYVDKAATGAAGELGTIGNPFRTLREAIDPALATSARQGDVLRVVGNGGTDGNLDTLSDNFAYEVGFNTLGNALSDGSTMRVPKGVSMVVDAGAIFKLRRANIEVGSFSLNVDRSLGSLQVLGTPTRSVHFTSYQNQQLGRDTFPPPTVPDEGDWGGLVFRDRFDYDAGRTVLESAGIFLNYVNHASFTYGGGDVLFDSRQVPFSPIYMLESRPTVTYNSIRLSSGPAMSADPDSFADTRFNGDLFTADYDRIGPEIQANRLGLNTINGLFVRVETETLSGQQLDKLNVPGRFDDTDIVHVIAENLLINGNPGGRLLVENPNSGDERNLARPDARLKIDPGIVVKLEGARIETEIDADLIAEGRARNRIIFTALSDDRFGGSGTFDTGGADPADLPEPGDWGGIYFGPLSDGSIDQALITFAGGITPIAGDFAGFNPVEIHQAKVRVTNSIFELNDTGFGGAERVGMSENGEATIFISGAQPIVVNNIIRDNAGPALNVNVNALNSLHTTDWGRSAGPVDVFTGVIDNYGPLVRGNLMRNNEINGMIVRGGTLTTQSVWDDTDIVHVLLDEVRVDNHHTFSGLRLQSSRNESLVVKLFGREVQGFSGAGITATGVALDIDDRIGGSVQILGTPGRPVVLASLTDDTVGAGLDPDANVVLDTNNDGILSSPAAGDWRSVRLERYSNDRNVDTVNEEELSIGVGSNINGAPDSAQALGELATADLAGDDNKRLGFEVHGFLNGVAPGDVDVYSFRAVPGTEIWIDLDRTAYALDTVIELIDFEGTVLARSDNSFAEFESPAQLVGAARLMQRDIFKGRDQYGTNPRDAGMRVVLPGPSSSVQSYFVRIRARGQDVNNLTGGRSMGEYQLQIRLRESDEVPGSTVRFADIRNSTNGIEMLGLPTRSPLLGDVSEDFRLPNGVRAEAQNLGSVLAGDLGVLSAAGNLSDPAGLDVDWYQFELEFALTQGSEGFLSTIFDIDYTDGLARPDTTLALFDGEGNLIMIARDSDITDDQPNPAAGSSVADATRGSFGKLDPFAGPFSIPTGENETYYLAVMSNKVLPTVLNATYQVDAANPLVRLEPLPETIRIADEHLLPGDGTSVAPPLFDLFPPTSALGLTLFADPLMLNDVNTWTVTGREMFTIDPYSGLLETDVTEAGELLPEADSDPFYTYTDVAMRNDGRIFTLAVPADPEDATLLREINPEDGSVGPNSASITELAVNQYTGPQDPAADPLVPEFEDISDRASVRFEAMAWAPGQNPRQRLLYAVGNIPGFEPYTAPPNDPPAAFDYTPPAGLEASETGNFCYPNFLYRIAGDEFFGDVPLGGILGIPDDPPYDGFEPTLGTNGCLDTRVETAPNVLEDGGLIKGITILEDTLQMFAVTDLGNLFEITDFASPTDAAALFVATLKDPLTDEPFVFGGLSAGPANAEEGALASVMFATTETGQLVAFDAEGALMPVFRDGAAVTTAKPVPVPMNGITFSRYDYNLWHISGRRDTEEGHGIEGQLGATRDRATRFDNFTYYFGLEDPRDDTTLIVQPYTASLVDTNVGVIELNGEQRPSYNVPGGAHGSLTTATFDLSPYTAGDKPTLYFNYWANTEAAASTLADYTLMRDSLRVYGTRDGANWLQLATNNSFPSDNLNELSELPNAISSTGGDYNFSPYPNQRVQELFDYSDVTQARWRQARVDIGDLAGSQYAQLRFEFSTAASVDFGMDFDRSLGASTYFAELGTGGIAVSPPAGKDLLDGDLFTLQALLPGPTPADPPVEKVQAFEFDTGYTFVVPVRGGQLIPDGEQFTVKVGRDDFKYEFDRNGPVSAGFTRIRINDSMAAGDVAQAMWDVMSLDIFDPATFQPLVWLNGERVNVGQTSALVTQSPNAIVKLEGQGPGSVSTPGAAPIRIHEGMTREEVTVAMSRDIDLGLAVNPAREGALEDYGGAIAKPDGKGALRVFGYEVGLAGPLAVGEALQGEQLVLPVPTFSTENEIKYYGNFSDPADNFRAQNNAFEGVYIDDFVIGFAERGELVVRSNAIDPANETFAVPQFPEEGEFFEEAVMGPYQLEIRLASATMEPDGERFDTIDTNDRLAEGMTMIAPAGDQIREGATFKLSDGVNTATFEFDSGNGVTPGNVRIIFTGKESAEEIVVLMRKAINSQTVIKVKADTVPSLVPAVATTDRLHLYGATGFVDLGGLEAEPNDSIAQAVNTGLTSATQGVWTRTGNIGDSGGFADVDMVSVQLVAGDFALIDVDVDRDSNPASAFNAPLLGSLHSALRVFDEQGNEVGGSFFSLLLPGPFFGDAPGELPSWDPSLRFVAPFTGTFYIGVSSGGFFGANTAYDAEIPRSGAGSSVGFYQLTVSVGASNAFSMQVYDTLFGDTNPLRQQGQVILQGNVITDALEYGVRIDADEREADNRPHPGAPRVLPDLNSQRLVSGLTVKNNVIAGATDGGILISGDAEPDGAVVFSRIINNTIYGDDEESSGFGINVNENASPTLLNNIVSNFDIGISVDSTSTSTVIGGTVYQGNTVNTAGTGVGSFPLLLDPRTPSDPLLPLFIDAPNGNFYLAPNSQAIDSSINTLQERPYMVSIGSAIGLAPSPILAPERDAFGQLRINDPDVPSPPGLGANVFKDRGAIDRADFTGPTSVLIVPEDNSPTGRDLDPAGNKVFFVGQSVTQFAVQLLDGLTSSGLQSGAGLDDATVTSDKFRIHRDGVLLTEGDDYFFRYDSLNKIVRLTPAEGIFTTGSTYTITLDNSFVSGIRDAAGNVLLPTEEDGAARFEVRLATADFGDAPDPNYPTVTARQGAVHILVPGVHLGAGVTSDDDGQPSGEATGDIDDGVTFASQLFAGQATTINVSASTAGKLDAWIDFNRDGDWDDAGEKVFNGRSLSPGNNALTVNVPNGAVTGETFARFRFSTAGGLNPTGLAANGEVEDYALQIAPAATYSIVVTSTEGRALGQDFDGRYGVGPGSEIVIQVYVDDQRLLANGGGVRAAFADLVASVNTLEFIQSSLTYGPTFTTSLSGTINGGGMVVDEAGGVGTAAPGGERQLLFSVRGRIRNDAASGTVIGLSTDAADDPGRTTRFYGSEDAVPPAFGQSALIVLEHPYQNPSNRFDVNNDGFVSGLDALILINRINAAGTPSVALPIPVTTSQPPYYDPNGDNALSALDVLQVINEINRRIAVSRGSGPPAPSPVPLTTSQLVVAPVQPNLPMPAYAGAFLPTTVSVAGNDLTARRAVDVLFTADMDDEQVELAAVAADDVWADDELSEEIASARPRVASNRLDELASLWIHETQDWTTTARETIVEKRSTKRWI